MLPIDFETGRRRAWVRGMVDVPAAYMTAAWLVVLATVLLGAVK